ncbi:Type IV secretion system protein virB9 [Paraburkholderia aspalathi]|uniref:Type IV secretion system protein virB9 n=1 Tax=Paraburkholderia aspalathi TaxID=1324617 RepID=A0ABN7MHH4_9BURK|nr:TrbG/VirB9 family P-type conjugative transfer protein [Paraburkholderia aspalathi]MBK3821589.1 TrbG/VirB9 family P-type conjugative transfer protein [Paraburkholderia aspalathi]MBK3833423.1 TrbG/VirB9 family P-type conjugative transfer protein [Paraburkholderia aspalathi]MBK3863156.1 TrbG/VirB9 family P-type conjugative transfer protein [Paraburkholderia aspalathi]CAE6806505.1 Type IV secretion system protein virB9 [Paraburkholderia aspalathi]
MKALAPGVALVGLLLTYSVSAADLPGWFVDSRVRQVVYEPDDVVRIQAQRGIATHIALDPHERILVVAPGDRDGWQVVANKGDHDVYLKPQLAAHDSNLEIRTDRRSYSFDLVVLPLKAKFGNYDVMYRVTFTYPDEVKALARANTDAALVEQRLAQPPVVRNGHYSMEVTPHSDDIAPTAAWDDGRFTYLRIPNNRRMPAVFRVADDGTESVVDKHVQGDTIVVHEVAKRFVLRLADEVVGIWNDAYDMDGVPPQGGTTASGVKRVLRSHGDE